MKYVQRYDGDKVHLPRHGHVVACCDCALVHVFVPSVDARGRVFIRVRVDKKLTKARRKATGKGPRT